MGRCKYKEKGKMKLLGKIGAVAAVVILCSTVWGQGFSVKDLRCEYRVNPLGVDSKKPRLSWVIESEKRGFIQGAYRILVASSRETIAAGNGDLWDSGKVKSNQSVNVVYDGEKLQSGEQCFWKVQVWDKKGKKSAQSEPASWSMGILNASQWKGKWIGLEGPPPAEENTRLAARMLRKEFEAEKKIKRATAYVCGLGMFELYLNGQKVGNHVQDPAWTLYTKRDLYVTFDVTEKIRQGANAVGVILGNARYYPPRKSVPFSSTYYFGHPRLMLQMEIEYEDGTKETVVSDTGWKLTTEGPIRANNEYDGEEYDARMEMPGWDKTGFDDSKWQKAEEVNAPGGILISQMIEPMAVTKTMRPIALVRHKPDIYIFGLGQNITGWVRLKVSGPRGTKVTMRFAESLDPNGMLYTANLRGAKVADTYTLKGEGIEVWEPRFTTHGFKYVELTGFPGKATFEAIEGRVSYTDLEQAGEFECSNRLINWIYKAIVWTIRGNYRGLPTDCPQRAERQGWLGDPAQRSKGESYVFSLEQFYAKWLDDMKDSQKENGDIANIVPPFFVPPKEMNSPPPGFVTIPSSYATNVTWPSAYVMIAGWYYEQYGDKQILEKHYPSMKKWMDLLQTYVKDGTIALDKYGDWCVPPESPELIHSKDPNRKTDGELLATTFYYQDLNLLAKYAGLLGKMDDAKEFCEQAERVKHAFNEKFLNKDKGIYSNGTQTSSILPLAFGMVLEEYREKVFNNLVDNIMVKCDGHIGTGIVGIQNLMRTLSRNGRSDVAYTLASQGTYPGWGYMIGRGATTMWELWNGDTANPTMNSRSHLMLVGDLVIWLYEDLAGIQAEPGYEKIVIKPNICGNLTFVNAKYKSVRGTVANEWKIEGDKLQMNVTIPANSIAQVYLSTADVKSVTEGGKKIKSVKDIAFLKKEGNYAVYAVGSGNYSFEAKQVKSEK